MLDEPRKLEHTSFDQGAPHALAIHAHALRDCSHRDAAEVEAHGDRRFINSEARATTPDAVPRRCADSVARCTPYLPASSLTVAPSR